MIDLTIVSDVITLTITLVGSLGATLPFIVRFKSKLTQTKSLIIAIYSALEDDKVTPAELKTIMKYAKKVIDKK